MGLATAMGTSMMTGRAVRMALRGLVALALLVAWAPRSFAQERYALVVSGASGSPELRDQMMKWRDDLRRVLVDKLKLSPDRVLVLSERADDVKRSASRDNVQAAFQQYKTQMTPADVLLVVLIGHGTFDGADAKFNLVGPDLEAADWKRLMDGMPGRVVFVNTASASFPFIERLAGPNRIVISATDTEAQKYQTVFASLFPKAFEDDASDLDKDGRVSVWEAFMHTSLQVKAWYEQRGQLSTERPLLDDNGDGVGRRAAEVTKDGALASRTFFDAAEGGAATNPALAELIGRRNLLESELEELKRKRQFMPKGDYERELERVVIAIARVSREIRTKT
jgi:hypothetical protein